MSDQDRNGVATTDAPLWTATLATAPERPIRGGKRLGLGLDFDARYIASPYASVWSRQGPHVNLDATVWVKTVNDRGKLALIGKNLTNKIVVTGQTDRSETGVGTGTIERRSTDRAGFGSLPRTEQVQLTWRLPKW